MDCAGKTKIFTTVPPNRGCGKEMDCVGRTKIFTIVPPNHFGFIPRVPLGSCWKFRIQASKAGVHRPQVIGIHRRDTNGTYSIVLTGFYEECTENGKSSHTQVARVVKISQETKELLNSHLIRK